MSTAVVPLWERDRACVEPVAPWILAFPMPGETAYAGATDMTIFPLEMTINDAVELWWRVKQFDVAVTDVDGWGDFTINCVRKRSGVTVLHEKELAHPESYEWEGSVYATSGIDTLYIGVLIKILPPEELEYNSDLDQVPFSYQIETGLAPNVAKCTPTMIFDINIEQNAGAEVINYVINYDDTFKTVDQVYDCTFNGEPIQLGIARMGTALDGPSFAVDITIGSWFSWDGTWNAATGERL